MVPATGERCAPSSATAGCAASSSPCCTGLRRSPVPVRAWKTGLRAGSIPQSRRLIDAGIPTLDSLVAAISSRGFRWHTKVPRLGVKAAQQIVDWLMLPETVESLDVRVSAWGIVPRKDLTPAMLALAPMGSAVVPLKIFWSRMN